ncbi:MAG TPA: AmmeMemoRadiSam system protein A [Thermoanaerobaculia bacterium]|nr:AmmeMemoRadiSam system protein A [Thermoanaerobaculia bacterium]
MLSNEQRKTLLAIARNSIAAALAGRSPAVDAQGMDTELQRPSGAFVTLRTHDGELRGCIGSIHAVAPMYRAVSTSAVSAALRDPRFRPLGQDELAQVTIEVSVMGPIERVMNVDQIVPGRDGLIISQGPSAGLLLPQVASEYGWDRLTFLRHTCQKAGLSQDAWRSPDCRIEKFSAEVFGEQEIEP